MIDLQLVLLGLGVGLAVTIPFGPVNVLAVDRALAGGFSAGFATGVGAAVADGLLAAFAVFSLHAAGSFLAAHAPALHVIGGAVLVGFGLVLMRRARAFQLAASRPVAALPAGLGAFALTVANPGGLLAIVGLVSMAPHLTQEVTLARGLVVAFSVVAGALVWWAALAALVDRFRAQIAPPMVARVGVACGAIVLCFGIAVLARSAVPEALAFIAG